MLSNAININDISLVLLKFAYGSMPDLFNCDKIGDLSEESSKILMGTYRTKGSDETLSISSDSENMVLQLSLTVQAYLLFANKGGNVFESDDVRLKFDPAKKELYFEQGSVRLTNK